MSKLARRDWLRLLGVGTASLFSPRAHASDGEFTRVELDAGGASGFSTRALALVPPNVASTGQRLLVLLHGYGPRTDELAMRSWQKDYGVERAHRRLREPPVRRLYETVRYLTDRRIAEIGRELAERAFEGMTLLCPVVPAPYFRSRSAPLFEAYSRWLVEHLVPTARTELGVSEDARRTGLAGVSMGGQFALEALARHPDAFGAVSGALAAIDKKTARRYGARVAAALSRNDPPRLQLLTATRDSYFEGNETLRVALEQRNVKLEFRAPFGPHNAGWMREVGSLELLLFMDRALGPRESDPPIAQAAR
jgi:pimeloyl-ACP methyl ester carboxylesterase